MSIPAGCSCTSSAVRLVAYLTHNPYGPVAAGDRPDQTLLLLAVIAVIIGYAAFVSPALGAAITVAFTVVGILCVIMKDDQGGKD
ncbi:hypothetical protein ABT090_33620 [Streptomyces asoensis]|uniref:hypothetical protein n=1 Tax=Streptomyces asoensis TaxID=249586 RepID=UPI003320FDDF